MADLLRVKSKVQDILAREFQPELTPDGGYAISYESARLFVDVRQDPEDADAPVFIDFMAPLVFDLPATPELFEYVATNSDSYLLGHLYADKLDDGTVTVGFAHSLLGDFLDDEEVLTAVVAVLGVGNEIDDEIKARFGGERYYED